MNQPLNDSNFLLYAARHYQSPHEDVQEFEEDLSRFKYIKRLFNKYRENGDLRERLILNHIIVVYNMFGIQAGSRMLFYKLDGYWDLLKPFVVLLGCLPDQIKAIGDYDVVLSSDIPMDAYVVNRLRDV